MEDFKEAEQAFNEEVSLRLKFENKINEIHGVHRELTNKHEKLYDDLKVKTTDLNTLKERFARLSEQHRICKSDLENSRKDNLVLKEERKVGLEVADECRRQVKDWQIREIEWKRTKDELTAGMAAS